MPKVTITIKGHLYNIMDATLDGVPLVWSTMPDDQMGTSWQSSLDVTTSATPRPFKAVIQGFTGTNWSIDIKEDGKDKSLFAQNGTTSSNFSMVETTITVD